MPIPLSIEKSSPIPIYYQLKERLALLIRDGTYPVGSQLPGELEMSGQLGISRGTVRQAISALVAEGRLVRVQGRGTFVTESPTTVLHLTERFTSFAEEMREMALPFSSTVLSRKIVPAEGRLVTKLNLQAGEPVVYLERLGTVETEPFVLAFTYLPENLCPGLMGSDLTDRSLYEVLEEAYGHRLSTAARTIEASRADEYEADLLRIPIGSPIHFMHSLAYLEDGRPIEYSRLRFRGDRSRITFEVRR